MPISGAGWELHVIRTGVQRRASDGKKRTVGTYQIYHNGVAMGGDLVGMVAETKGPGANRPVNNGLRIKAGTYRVSTHSGDGQRYVTNGYRPNAVYTSTKKPSLRFLDTDQRTGILIHPGQNFLSSVGCFNPCTQLPDATEPISWAGSLRRMIAIIEDLRAFSGGAFPNTNNVTVPNAHFVVDGEP